MKLTHKYNIFALWIIIIQIIIIFLYPKTAYAMSPEEIQTVINNHDLQGYIDPKTYWTYNQHDNDAYAINQRNIYLKNEPFYSEPRDYPITLSDTEQANKLSKGVVYKSKFFWIVWKKHTNEFDSFNKYKRSINNSFSIRTEFKKEFNRIFPKSNK